MTLKFATLELPVAGDEQPVPTTALDASYVWAKATGFKQYAKPPFLVAFEMPIPKLKADESPLEHYARFFETGHPKAQSLWWNKRFLYGTTIADERGLARLEKGALEGVISHF